MKKTFAKKLPPRPRHQWAPTIKRFKVGKFEIVQSAFPSMSTRRACGAVYLLQLSNSMNWRGNIQE